MINFRTDEVGKRLHIKRLQINILHQRRAEKPHTKEERIAVLKDTLEVKNSIIELKDDNLQNQEKLYNIEKAEVRSLKIKKTWEKILTLGLGAYAFSQLDDSSDKAVVGGLTIYLVTN